MQRKLELIAAYLNDEISIDTLCALLDIETINL